MNRRTFLSSAAAGVALTGLPAAAAVPATQPRRLTVGTRSIEVNGRAAKVYGLLDQTGARGLTFAAGEAFDVTLVNALDEPTMVHWHGLLPPNTMDGVPDLPLPMLEAGERRAYSFAVGAGGTHWMHAHTLQEQNLLAAPLIVRTAEDLAVDEQEIVVLLHDFSFTPASELLAALQGSSASTMSMSASSSMGDMGRMAMPSGMDMSSMMTMDLNDIAYDAFLANDRTLDDPEVVRVDKGGRVRLRIINGATSTGFTIDTGALGAEAIAVDGQPVAPLSGTSFPLSMGQRLDLRLRIPSKGGAFPVLALREGAPERTGIILATAGAAVAKLAPVAAAAGPRLDLTMEAILAPLTPLAARDLSRRYTAHLGGSMTPYAWSIAGGPFRVTAVERVEIELMNMSMMAHPMHLHGHHFQVVAINGRRRGGAVRDTVLVPPMQSVTIAFDALNPAPAWAFHCHHLYHMATGMMATLDYA